MMQCEPIEAETEQEPKSDKIKQQLKKIKIFKSLDENGKDHTIEMKLINNNIELKSDVNNNNSVMKEKYCNIFSFNQLKKNNIFAIQENIEEIFDQLEIYVSDEQVYSQISDNNLIITIFTRVKKYPEIKFELKKQNLNKDEMIKILSERISKLESENEKILSKFTILELENKDLKKEIESIKEYIEDQKNKQNLFKDSLILKPEEINMVCNWIDPNKKIKARLLYRASRDGEGSEMFHNFCDYKGPIIIFIKEKDNPYRFGAYTGLLWTSENMFVYDKDAFLFSLSNKIKIKNNNTEYTVFHRSEHGPAFGTKDDKIQLAICMGINNILKCFIDDSGFCYTFNNKDFIGTSQSGRMSLTVEDYEVYLVEI